MAEENQTMESAKAPNPKKRALGRNKKAKNTKMKKKPRTALAEGIGGSKLVKFDRKMKKLIRKRARNYNSDEDGDGGEDSLEKEDEVTRDISDEELEEDDENREIGDANEGGELSDEEESGVIQPGITKFTEGCRAFRLAFKSIVKKAVHGDPLGPVMSAHQKLLAEKLAEEEAERKVKRESKKEKRLIAEKGHVKPDTYLNLHEKFLIGVATKGGLSAVKLFNAVNKAQNAQKGLNPSRSKDEKAIRKRRKEAFFSELKKTQSARANTTTALASSSQADDEGPAWAPLRDNYMLTSSKLKDWDKLPDNTATDDIGSVSDDSSSDDE